MESFETLGYYLGVMIGATIKNLPLLILIVWLQARDRRKLQDQIDTLRATFDAESTQP